MLVRKHTDHQDLDMALNSVDILMATFNGQRYVQEQIDSITRQTHQSWRLLVRDDGSSDDTVAICKAAASRDDRIVVVEDDIGNLGFNRNYLRLLALSSAPYAMFCDQDDFWMAEKIALTLEAARNSVGPGEPLMVHCDSVVTDGVLTPIASKFVGRRAKHIGLRSVLMANPAQGATIMVNAALRELMLRQEAPLPYDYQAALIAEATGRRIFIAKPLMLYRQHGGNVIGASLRPGRRASSAQPSKLSPTLAIAIDGARAVEACLNGVKDRWKPGAEQEIERLSRLASAEFSLRRLYYAVAGGFQFYRRQDRLNLVLYALGLPSLPS